MQQVDECDHGLSQAFQSQMKARRWVSKRVLSRARKIAWQGRQYCKHFFIAPCCSWKIASLHFDWQQLDITVGMLWSRGWESSSWNMYLYKFAEVITSRDHYKLPGRVSKPGNWLKIINKTKCEHLSKNQELTKSSSSYRPRIMVETVNPEGLHPMSNLQREHRTPQSQRARVTTVWKRRTEQGVIKPIPER